MVKPIGNLVSNLRPNDKVSARIQARFGGKSLGTHAASDKAAAQPTNSAKPVNPGVKYKKRKR